MEGRTDGRTETQVKQYIYQFHSVHLVDIITGPLVGGEGIPINVITEVQI